MFDFLFDVSAFKISASVQAVNNILFPVVLFVIIFLLLCEIFLVDVTVENKLPVVDEKFAFGVVQTKIDEEIIYREAEDNSILENLLTNMAATIGDYKAISQLLDIDVERQNLKALGARKLRGFCKSSKIKGYAAAYNQRGLESLVEFLLQQQIYACNIEQQLKCVEMSAIR
jgi:hypothetical protein